MQCAWGMCSILRALVVHVHVAALAYLVYLFFCLLEEGWDVRLIFKVEFELYGRLWEFQVLPID